MSDIPLSKDEQVFTPGRSSYVVFDEPEFVLTSPEFFKVRRGGEVCRPAANGKGDDYNMKFWKTQQCWTIKPAQLDIAAFHFRNNSIYAQIAQQAVLRLEEILHVPYAETTPRTGLVQEFAYRPANGSITGTPTDPFLVKKVVPDQWSAALNSNYGIGFPNNPYFERIAESLQSYPENTPWFLRWIIPGNAGSTPGSHYRFYFGQYALDVNGDGNISLHMKPNEAGVGEIWDWERKCRFRYSEQSKVCNTQHTIAVVPTFDVNTGKRLIVFLTGVQDAVGVWEHSTQSDYGGKSTGELTYVIDSYQNEGDPDYSPGYSTMASVVRLDAANTLRGRFQISRLGYLDEGTLTDIPDALPSYGTANNPLTLTLYADIPDGTRIDAYIFDEATRQPFRQGIDRKPYVKFEFYGSTFATPKLYGYKLSQKAECAFVEPGAFTAKVDSVSLEAFTGDAKSESSSFTVSDTFGEYTRLRNRGRFHFSLRTSYRDPWTLEEQDVILHKGYILRPNSEKHGKPGREDGYPSPDWRQFQFTGAGMYHRLSERVETTFFRNYAIDDNADPDPVYKVKPPWKVTSKIRDLLYAAGFAPIQVNIPDLPWRLFPGEHGLKEDDVYLRPKQGYAEEAVRTALMYLGAYLYFEENALPYGEWRLLFAPAEDAEPVAKFVTSAPEGVIPTLLGAYPPNTYPVLYREKTQIIPPDFNCVWVVCPVNYGGKDERLIIQNWLGNPKSYNVPGISMQADPEHPAYIGYPIILPKIDPTLAGIARGGNTGAQETQAAVDWVCNRLYDFTCHAQRIQRFRSALAMVKDASIGNRYRPIRFLDPVTYNGKKYYVKSASPDYSNDRKQMMNYELIQPQADKEEPEEEE